MKINCSNAKEAYESKLKLSKKQVRGCFKQISEKLDITPQQTKDYYGNTWVQPFFVDISGYKQQLKQCINTNKYCSTDEIYHLFMKETHYQQFNSHKLRQLIGTSFRNKKNFLKVIDTFCNSDNLFVTQTTTAQLKEIYGFNFSLIM